MRARLTYTWPSIRKDIKAHVDACKWCLELQPSKPQACASGLNILVEKLNPMDWLSTDLAQKVLRNGKKVNFLVIVDKASCFVRVYQLRGTKTNHIIECLQEFVEAYCGPLYWITRDGDHSFLLQTRQSKIGVWLPVLHTNSALPTIPNRMGRLNMPCNNANLQLPTQRMI